MKRAVHRPASPDPRIHVLHLAEDFLPQNELSGGVRVAVYHEVLELARRMRVTVFAPRIVLPPLARYAEARAFSAANARKSTREADPPGVRVLRPRYFHVPWLWPFTEPLQLLLIGLWVVLLYARDVNVVHGHRLYPMGAAAILIARMRGGSSVITSHGSGLHTTALSGPRRVRWWIRYVLRTADRIVAVSRDLAAIARKLGVPDERCRYIPNGVDTERFHPGDRCAARNEKGIAADRYVFVHLAYFLPIKAHSVLVEAFRILHGRRPESLLLLAGDGPLLPEIRRQVSEAGLDEHVRFLGPIDHGHAPGWLQASDCTLLPSYNEGTPLVVLEGLACGKPVVATAVGGTSEVVADERYGLLVPPGDAPALAAAMEQAMEREWDVAELRARAGEYAWPRIADRLQELYREIVPHPPA